MHIKSLFGYKANTKKLTYLNPISLF